MTDTELLTTGALATAAGTTTRKIQLWTTAGVIEPTRGTRGSGHYARYHPNLIPLVATLEQTTSAFGGSILHSVLRRIADHHADGALEIAPGIVLVWEPPPPLEHLLTDEQADRLLAELRRDNPPHQVTGGFRP